MARLDASLVSSGRISGATSARASTSGAVAATDARREPASDATIQGMPLVTPDQARVRAAVRVEQGALDQPTIIDGHRTTPGLTDAPATLAVGEARQGGALANAATTFAPLQGLRDAPRSPAQPTPAADAGDREPTRLLTAVSDMAPRRVSSAPTPQPAQATLAAEPLPSAPRPAPTFADEPTSPATAFGGNDPIASAPSIVMPVAAADVTPSRPRQLHTDPLPEHLRAGRIPTPVVSYVTPPAGSEPRANPSGSVPANPPLVIHPITAKTGPRPATVSFLHRRKALLAGAVGAIAVAASAALLLRGRAGGEQGTAAEATGPWSAKVVQVSRASADKEGGLEACSAKRGCWAIAQGATIEAGWKVKTDARTRAYLELGDGSQLAIDRGTEVELPRTQDRTARLAFGNIVADVAKVEGAPAAHILLPNGDIEVLGTKLSVSADRAEDGGRATVEVVRGWVKVHDETGRIVEVRAGEEASLVRGAEPTVASATSLSDVMEWSDRTPEEVDAPVLRGLGELRAKKPGETKERNGAVVLSKHDVKVRVVDVVARTEVDETFTNTTDEELEGIFRFPLRPAPRSKLSLEVDGKLLDGAFVDRERGAAIWRGVIQNAAPKAPKPREEIVWVPGPWRDPALLEWQRGGRFELKIFPTPKRGSRRVVLTYTQTVEQAAGVRRFTYPLAHDQSGTTKIDSFNVDLQVLGHDKAFGVKTRGYELTTAAGGNGDAERKTMQATAFVPAGDLTVEYALPDRDREITAWGYKMEPAQAVAAPGAPARPSIPAGGQTAEQKAAVEAANALSQDTSAYVAISLRPKLPRWQEAKGRVHALVVDTSRSMIGERYARATRLASSLVREMDRRDSFVLLACDTTCRAMGGGPGPAGARPASVTPSAPGAQGAGEVERFLGSIEPDGGSDLVAAVSAARAAAGALGGKELRIVYLGDGTPTVGPTRGAHIESAVKSVLPAGEGGVIAVALGSDADTTSLAAMARGGGGVMVPYVPGQKVSSAALDVLAAAYGVVLRDAEVELPAGFTQVTPARLDPIRAGGETFVLARMSGDAVKGTVKVRGRVAGERFEQTFPLEVTASTGAGNAFVPRMFAAAKIAELERTGGDDAVKPTIVELSRRFAVASRFTSLLVLESEAMFDAFGLKRDGLVSTFTGEERAESQSADVDGEAEAAKDEGKLDVANPYGASGDDKGVGRAAGGGFAPPRGPAKSPAPLAASKPSPAAEPVDASPQASAAPGLSAPATKSGEEKSKKEVAGQAEASARRWRERDLDRARRLVPMRRVFDRKASFDSINTLAQQAAPRLLVAENALSSTPDSRDKTVELFALYSTSGRIGEAQELTARWSGRDALDPDAITARADLAARQGDRERAIRILGGLTDVRPGDKAPQLRLAEMHEAAGNTALACQHRITAAELAPADTKIVSEAVRCARTQGMVDLAGLLKSDAPAATREAIEKALLTTSPTSASTLRGDVQISAEWSGGGDLDISLVDAQGRRLSWMGSPNKSTGVNARDVTSVRSEGLGFTNLASGSYVVEISRAAGGDSGEPARGEVTMRLAGETRRVPFNLTGARAEVGTVRVFFTSRLVPVEGMGWR
ncbi:MAG: FecR domain-containing protein [Polyangiaceae bacterium]